MSEADHTATPGGAGSQELNPRYTFARFVVGAANEMAYALASAVAVQPGRAYNPLLIYGETGLGKTHLMHAVAHDLLARQPSLQVRCLSAAAFLDAVLVAIAEGSLDAWQAELLAADVLLVDDVHTLANRPQVERVFARVFEAFVTAGRQVMVTLDRPLDHSQLSASLVAQFERGQTAQLTVPQFEHRLAILSDKVRIEKLEGTLSPDVLEVVAMVATQNVRALEGALTRLMALAKLRHQPITVALAREVLHVDRAARVAALQAGTITPAAVVIDAVAAEWTVTPEALTGGGRAASIIEPRQVAMYLCRELFALPFSEIGRAFNKRDHSTVIHAVDRARDRVDTDRELRRRVVSLERTLRALAPPGLVSR